MRRYAADMIKKVFCLVASYSLNRTVKKSKKSKSLNRKDKKELEVLNFSQIQ